MPLVDGDEALAVLLKEGVVWGDSAQWLPRLPKGSVDLFFMSPPYADARAYSKISPDRYVEWFLPFAEAMLMATKETGSFVLNIKNRVAKSGPLRGHRHPYVYQLGIALQDIGWRWCGQPAPIPPPWCSARRRRPAPPHAGRRQPPHR